VIAANQVYKGNSIMFGVKRENSYDFMDRSIIITKYRVVLRDENNQAVNSRNFYIEMSALRNKVFFTLVDL